MIPQIGFTELLLVGALALIIVGPKDLPLMMRKVGKLWGQARGLAREFQSSFEELGRQAEIEELRKEVEALKRGDPVKDIQKELDETGDAVMAPLNRKPPADDAHEAGGAPEPETKAEGDTPDADEPPEDAKSS